MIRSTMLLIVLAFLLYDLTADDAPAGEAGSKDEIFIRVRVLSMNVAEWNACNEDEEVNLPLMGATTQEMLDRVAVYRDMKLVRMHAETTLTTRAGDSAKLINGGEYPVSVPQCDGTWTLERREYSQTVDVVPKTANEGRFELECTVEHSWTEMASAVRIDGVLIPGFNQRIVYSRIRLEPGQSAVAATPGDDNQVFIVLMTPERRERRP